MSAFSEVSFTARKARTVIQVSWELLEDFPFYLKIWTVEEWAQEIERRRGVRRALEAQPLASLKRAATKDIQHAEAILADWPGFGHWTYEDDIWKHRATWYQVP